MSTAGIVNYTSLALLLTEQTVVVYIPTGIPIERTVTAPLLSIVPFPPLLVRGLLTASFNARGIVSLSFDKLPFLSYGITIVCYKTILIAIVSPRNALEIETTML